MNRKFGYGLLIVLLTLGNGPRQEQTPEATPAGETTAEATAEATADSLTGGLPDFPGTGSFTVRQRTGGFERSYRVYIPESYKAEGEPTALLIVLHGAGGSGASIESVSRFNDLADRQGFVVAYPDGLNNVWNDGRIGDERIPDVDDVAFIGKVIDFVTGKLNIDAARVYATGYSMGGMLAFRAGCVLGDRIAAVASVASTLPEYLLPECADAGTLPVLIIHGTDDPVIPWMGVPARGRGYLSADNSAYFWQRHNECATALPWEVQPDTQTDDGTMVVVERYTDCTGEAEVVIYGVYHGGHTWPGSPFDPSLQLGPTSLDIDATAVIWEFLKGKRVGEG